MDRLYLVALLSSWAGLKLSMDPQAPMGGQGAFLRR